MDGSCGYDGYNCNDYWDAFEMSLLAGADAGSGYSWVLYGPPAIGYAAVEIEQTAVAYQGTDCVYPTAESTTYSLKEDSSGGYYGAGFKMALTVPGSANLSGRKVQETLSNVSTSCTAGQACNPNGNINSCWFDGSPYQMPTNNSFSADTWNVHSGNTYGDQGTSGADGPDYIGWSVTEANYYQGRSASLGIATCTMFTLTQAMTMSSCTTSTFTLGTASEYDTGHFNWFNIGSASMTGTRQNVQGAAQ